MAKIKEKITVKIPAIKLKKELLEEISNIIKTEREIHIKETNDEYSSITYSLQTEEKEIEMEELSDFLAQKIPNNFVSITINFFSVEKDIYLSIYPESELGDITVTGADPTWVNGVAKRLENVFIPYRTKNDFFQSRKVWLLGFAISGLLSFGSYLILWPNVTDEPFSNLTLSDQIIEGIILIFTMIILNSYWGWVKLLRKLFPKIEMESSTPSKIKNFILVIIIGIITTVVSSGIISRFQ